VRSGSEERETIVFGSARGESLAVTARRWGRATSTVSREAARCDGTGRCNGRVTQRLACEQPLRAIRS